MSQDFIMGLAGGCLIGLSAALLLLFAGKIAGISGICSGLFPGFAHDGPWRWLFVLGLVAGGFAWLTLWPEKFGSFQVPHQGIGMMAFSGFLVGFGTRLGSGCTSGHGICGVSRGSKRSITATGIFVAVGMLTVLAVRFFHAAF